MVWGAITINGPGPLYFVEGTMKQDQYKKVLETVALPYFHEIGFWTSSFIFMQDGAPCHTAKSVKKFISDKNIPLLPWPGNSPDLNPIENVWHELKRLVYKENNTNRQVLIENIKKIWYEAPEIKACIKACIESMPRRIKAVKLVKGGNTKY